MVQFLFFSVTFLFMLFQLLFISILLNGLISDEFSCQLYVESDEIRVGVDEL